MNDNTGLEFYGKAGKLYRPESIQNKSNEIQESPDFFETKKLSNIKNLIFFLFISLFLIVTLPKFNTYISTEGQVIFGKKLYRYTADGEGIAEWFYDEGELVKEGEIIGRLNLRPSLQESEEIELESSYLKEELKLLQQKNSDLNVQVAERIQYLDNRIDAFSERMNQLKRDFKTLSSLERRKIMVINKFDSIQSNSSSEVSIQLLSAQDDLDELILRISKNTQLQADMKIEINKLQQQKNEEKRDSRTSLADVDKAIKSIKLKLKRLDNRKSVLLKAPYDGVIVNISSRNGDYVKAGESLGFYGKTLIPTHIETFIASEKIKDLKLGGAVSILLNSNEVMLKKINGVVSHISKSHINAQEQTIQPTKTFYKVEIALNDSSNKYELFQGEIVYLDIVTDSKSILTSILSQ